MNKYYLKSIGVKKFLAVLFSLGLLVPALAFAEGPKTSSKGEAVGHIFQTLLDKKSNKDGENATTSPFSMANVTGSVASVSGQSISLTVSGGTDTVDATNAKIYRKFGATMLITDIVVGDSLTVRGTINGSTLTATTIRDMSQQQRSATFSGSVVSVSGSSFVLASHERGNQTINTSSSTVFKENGQSTVTIANVTIGENVIASGVWDSQANTVAADKVTIVVRSGTVSGVFQSFSGEVITMSGKNASSTIYSVDVTNAKLVRHFGAAMQLADYQSGDMLEVSGIINGSSITAKIVRDDSLQAHNGTFVGTVSAINGSSFTLQSRDRGVQTINTTSTTVFRLGSPTTTIASLALGETVTVSGVWDRVNTNVTANKVSIKVSSLSITGTLQSISGSTLTVMSTGTTASLYTINASSAKIYYAHGHKGDLTILQVGDSVKVYGKATSGSTSVTASIVLDSSRTFKAPSPTPGSTTNQ